MMSRLLISVLGGVCLVVVTMPHTTFAERHEDLADALDRQPTNLEGRRLPPEARTRFRVFVHRVPQPSHRRQPVCVTTVNDRVQTFGLTGWHVPSGGLGYEVNIASAPDAVESDVLGALERATAAWAGADADKRLTFLGTTTTTRARYDGHHTILWRRLPRSVLAVAYVWSHPSTGEVLDAALVFNTRVPWSVNAPTNGDCGGIPETYDLQAIATHEFGHWFGLEDLYSSEAADLTMYGVAVTRELKKTSLGAGDILGAQAVAP